MLKSLVFDDMDAFALAVDCADKLSTGGYLNVKIIDLGLGVYLVTYIKPDFNSTLFTSPCLH